MVSSSLLKYGAASLTDAITLLNASLLMHSIPDCWKPVTSHQSPIRKTIYSSQTFSSRRSNFMSPFANRIHRLESSNFCKCARGPHLICIQTKQVHFGCCGFRGSHYQQILGCIWQIRCAFSDVLLCIRLCPNVLTSSPTRTARFSQSLLGIASRLLHQQSSAPKTGKKQIYPVGKWLWSPSGYCPFALFAFNLHLWPICHYPRSITHLREWCCPLPVRIWDWRFLELFQQLISQSWFFFFSSA